VRAQMMQISQTTTPQIQATAFHPVCIVARTSKHTEGRRSALRYWSPGRGR
jgi:hypothetical protein